MSKSIGNVISPYDLVEKYGTEATRYLLLRHVHPFDDSDITWERLDEWYTANLVNGLGNLVARVMKLAETHVTTETQKPIRLDAKIAPELERFAFSEALDAIWHYIGVVDERITREEPFRLVKENPEAGKAMIASLVADVTQIAHMLAPFMPKTSEIILSAVANNTKPENLFPRL